MTTPIGKPKILIGSFAAIIILTFLAAAPTRLEAQQKELPEINILTAVNNMAFSAVWVAEQLKYFEQEEFVPKSRWRAAGRLVKPQSWDARRNFAHQARKD